MFSLLVEVSDSSLAIDVEKKLPFTGARGVAEVWIVNLEDLASPRNLSRAAF
jgi:Uma2 family endonuclease